MRKLLIALLVALPFTVLAAPSKTVTLAVQNMTCPLCPITVKKSLEKVAGVSAVQVDFDKKNSHRHLRPGQGPAGSADQGHDQRGLPVRRAEVMPR